MVQIALLGVITVLLAVQFKSQKSEYELLICICGGVIILGFALSKMNGIVRGIRQIQSYTGMDEEYYQILIKIIGITYISEFASDICKDTGHASIGNYVEIAGKLCIMAISMPIILALLDTIRLF